MKGRGLVIEWDKKLGYSANPFERKIIEPVEQFFVGSEKERRKLNLFIIKKHGFGVIAGPEGSGKTTLLLWLRSQLQPYKSRIAVKYYRPHKLIPDDQFVKLIVKPLYSSIEKAELLFRRLKKMPRKITSTNLGVFLKKKLRTKRYLLLIDEVEKLTKSNIEILKRVYDEVDNLHVIVTTTESNVPSFSHLKDFLKINLGEMSIEECRQMIKKRIEAFGGHDILPFDDKVLHKMHKDSKGNPKRFLQFCHETALKLSLDDKKVKSMHDTIARIRAAELAKKRREARVRVVEKVMQREKNDVKKGFRINFRVGSKEPSTPTLPPKEEPIIEPGVNDKDTEAMLADLVGKTAHLKEEVVIESKPEEVVIHTEEHKHRKTKEEEFNDDLIGHIARDMERRKEHHHEESHEKHHHKR